MLPRGLSRHDGGMGPAAALCFASWNSSHTVSCVQYWKSNPMFWCEYCKVWLQDKPGAKATHERGIKHKDNVTRSASLC